MNKSDFFVRTGRANANFVIGAGVVLSLFICSMLGLSCYSEPQEKEFFIILWCPFIVLGGWLTWFAWWVKYDYFKADSKGITIDVRSNSPFPKYIQRSYRWEELSAYSLDADHIEKSAYTISHWRYTLKLYGANGQLLEKIKPHTLFDGNLQGLGFRWLHKQIFAIQTGVRLRQVQQSHFSGQQRKDSFGCRIRFSGDRHSLVRAFCIFTQRP